MKAAFDPIEIARRLAPRLAAQLSAHDVVVTSEQVRAVAANLAYSLVEVEEEDELEPATDLETRLERALGGGR